jgi:hypothetical protein
MLVDAAAVGAATVAMVMAPATNRTAGDIDVIFMMILLQWSSIDLLHPELLPAGRLSSLQAPNDPSRQREPKRSRQQA